MALDTNTPTFIQANSYPAEVTRRGTYGFMLARDGSGHVGSVAGGVVNLSAGDLLMAAPVSGLSVNLPIGELICPGNSTTSQGGYYMRNASTTNLSIATADPTNPRIDLVCATVKDAAYSGVSNTGVLQVLTGTPTSGATLSNLTGAPSLPTSSLLIGYVLVPANATNIITADLGDHRAQVALFSGLVPTLVVWTTVAASGSGSVNAVSGNSYLVSSGNTPFVLPAPAANAQVQVTNYGTGIPTISQHGSEKIFGLGCGSSGVTSISLGTFGATATIESDGTSWYITSGMQDTGWLSVTQATAGFTNSWAAGYATPGFRITGNVVRWRGGIGSGSTGTNCFTLNTQFRPPQHLSLAVLGNGAPAYGYFDIPTSGVVQVNNTNAGSSYTILDGLTYTID